MDSVYPGYIKDLRMHVHKFHNTLDVKSQNKNVLTLLLFIALIVEEITVLPIKQWLTLLTGFPVLKRLSLLSK